jgi:ADP-heptose:LPS heptosyltransferase
MTEGPRPTGPSRHSRRRIAVVRMLPGLGDLVCAVPALRALRAAEPSAHVTFIGLPAGAWLRERFPGYIDRWLPCNTCPGLPESKPDPLAHDRLLGAARASRFDLAVQLHGDGRVTNSFTASLGATRWGGLRRPGTDESNPLLAELRPGRHETERCCDALRAVGITNRDTRLEFPLRAGDRDQLDAVLGTLPSTLAVLHPGASRPDRCWSASSFAAIADQLTKRVERVVLTGSAAEVDVVAAVGARAAVPPIELAGRTSLGALAALLAAARVVVCNDTGVAHLAAAVGTPTVTVFARSDRPRWAVRGDDHHGVHGHNGEWPDVDAVATCVDAVLAGTGDA